MEKELPYFVSVRLRRVQEGLSNAIMDKIYGAPYSASTLVTERGVPDAEFETNYPNNGLLLEKPNMVRRDEPYE